VIISTKTRITVLVLLRFQYRVLCSVRHHSRGIARQSIDAVLNLVEDAIDALTKPPRKRRTGAGCRIKKVKEASA